MPRVRTELDVFKKLPEKPLAWKGRGTGDEGGDGNNNNINNNNNLYWTLARMIPTHLHNHSTRKGLLEFPFYNWEIKAQQSKGSCPRTHSQYRAAEPIHITASSTFPRKALNCESSFVCMRDTQVRVSVCECVCACTWDQRRRTVRITPVSQLLVLD